MKAKNISYRSSNLLAALVGKNQVFFDVKEATEILKNSSERAVRELLRGMVNRGLLLRIKDGLFHVIPYEADSENYFPNWHLVAKHLVGKRDYYIGYFSALQTHELTTQPSLVEQIVVNKQYRPSKMEVRGVKFQFIYHKETRFFGFKNTWIDDFNKIIVSDLEKTLLDCLYKPEHAGGIIEIAKALHKAKEKLNFDKLSKYIDEFDAQSVIKRLGFLLDGFIINPSFTEKLATKLSGSYIRLDPSLPKEGKYLSKWKLQVNLEPSSIFTSITT